MKLSILIPTHNRPQLFHRCILSILPYLEAGNIEVIVNNDSHDITTVNYHNIRYYYDQFPSVSSVYQSLYHRASGEYIWYVEDDDYLNDNLGNILDLLDGDVIVGNYCPKYPNVEPFQYLRQFKNNKVSPEQFVATLNTEPLQLGQYIFRSELVRGFDFPPDNNVYNDLNLVLHCLSNIGEGHVTTLNRVLYYQTKDGGDNISFPDTKHSIPTVANYDFLQKYPSALRPIIP